MARICPLTGRRPVKGNHIWRSGKAKKKGGIGTHVTAITKRKFYPNLQRVKAVVNGEVRYIEGNPEHPLNNGVLCAKGSSGIMKQYSPARLTKPL